MTWLGYGCTTRIGNSGPRLSAAVDGCRREPRTRLLSSGNCNFEAASTPWSTCHASPPLVVAYALAGTLRRDLTAEPRRRE